MTLNLTSLYTPTRSWQLPYTSAVINEALRLYLTVFVTSRVFDQPVELSGGRFTVPSGVTIIAAMQSIHLNPAYWEAPNAFRPERFLKVLSTSFWSLILIMPGHTCLCARHYLPHGSTPMNHSHKFLVVSALNASLLPL